MDRSNPMEHHAESEKKTDNNDESGKATASDPRFSKAPVIEKAPSSVIGDFRGGRVYISLYDTGSRA